MKHGGTGLYSKPIFYDESSWKEVKHVREKVTLSFSAISELKIPKYSSLLFLHFVPSGNKLCI